MIAVGNRLFIANHRAGSVTVVDAARGAVAAEAPVGTQLSDLIRLPARDTVLATDEAQGQIIELSIANGVPRVMDRLAVGPSPVTACAWPDHRTCSVALLWAHRLAIVDLGEGSAASRMRLIRTIDLPFAPRKQWIAPDGKTLVVADSFGGNLALFDLPAGTLRGYRSIDGHNIRGISATPDGREVLIAHSILDQRLSTERDHVFWGQLMGNLLRSVKSQHLLYFDGHEPPDRSKAWPIAHWSAFTLGIANHGAGDPGDILFAPDGQLVVALSGVDEVVVRKAPGEEFWGILVGRMPTALTMGNDGRSVYVANTLDDSISVIDLPTFSVVRTIALGPQPQMSAADRGESLFYDARLSLDGWYSCNSCHTDGHTCGLLNDNYSDGSFGTPKRILSLLGTADTGPWAWNGSNVTLEQQIHNSIRGTMQGKEEEASDEHISDLVAYLRKLKPPPSLDAARGTLDQAAIERGRHVFDRLECAECHKPPAYTSSETYDVGMPDAAGLRKFNPPSLRGLSQRSAYFHDSRAKDLREVFTRFGHPERQSIPENELDDLVEFLRSL